MKTRNIISSIIIILLTFSSCSIDENEPKFIPTSISICALDSANKHISDKVDTITFSTNNYKYSYRIQRYKLPVLVAKQKTFLNKYLLWIIIGIIFGFLIKWFI